MSDTPSDPTEAGKDLQPPEAVNNEETMTNENPTKIAQAVNGFAQMDARQQTIHVWSVTSWRNGENTRHEVNLLEGTCTCDDMAYNQDGNEVCDHIMKANHVATAEIDIKTALVHDLHNRMDRLEQTADRLEQAKTEYHAKMADASDTDSKQSPEEAVEQATPEPDVDPQLAAEKLQNAYDDVVDDMQVKVHNRSIWIQTGRDTPDDFPAPGNMSTFEVLLQSPEQVEYIHDDHQDIADKPGEWWKNRMKPSDVETYINEVLN